MHELISINPANGETVWQGEIADADAVDHTVRDALRDFETWQHTTFDHRRKTLLQFAEQIEQTQEELATLIMRETGKPKWEAAAEAALVSAKVHVTLEAHEARQSTRRIELSGAEGVERYRALGVVGVIGPFNLPAHLPNGHIVPALLAGNTVVFKPSELTPGVGAWLNEAYRRAGLPCTIVQGGRETGAVLVDHTAIAGVCFTGSYAGGCAIHRALAGRPSVMLALEMGGNNPLVVDTIDDVSAAAYTAIVSAYITSGQRCTCARRLIVVDEIYDAFVSQFTAQLQKVRIDLPSARPQPFMSCLISEDAAARVLDAQQALLDSGAASLIEMQQLGRAMLSPGLVDVTGIQTQDEEHFGPLLQLTRVRDFEEAMQVANATRYGLAAGLLSNNAAHWRQFAAQSNAGIVNYNGPTTGASGRLPFGGTGYSGNHRPSGYHAIDYCADPVASVQRDRLCLPEKLLPGINV